MALRPAALTFLLVFGLFLQGPTRAAAEDATVEDFAGTWIGTGLKEEFVEEGYYAYQERDLNVTIEPADDGFTISWLTGMREQAGGPVTKVKSTTLAFQKNDEGYYAVADIASPAYSHSHIWARLDGQQLIVYTMVIHPEGYYELSMYVRTLNPDGSMTLGFIRNLDGRPVRRVTGQLSRQPE
ncbi:MAG TPA: hypothetical protein VKN76_07890 [Kiloniellaceae bacterium]|nr:hypothetical protein [Kiloniellaceae bacterium]